MKHPTKLKSGIVFLFAITISSLFAQESVQSAGGKAQGDNGSISYSVGQVVYTSASGPNGSAIQGVQYAYIISIPTGVDKPGVDLTFKAYPNPTDDFLTLTVPMSENAVYHYRLYNLNGKLLLQQNATSGENAISMQAFGTGQYLLKIFQHQQGKEIIIQSFKIIKK